MTQPAPTARVELLVRAADAGDTYVTWRWLDDVTTPHAQRLNTATLVAALAVLDSALMSPLIGETSGQAHQRAFSRGAFATRESEQQLAHQLADAVLPDGLREQIIDRAHRGHIIRLRLTPSPRLARIPWELLYLDTERRLLEAVDIVYDPPATVHAERGRIPTPWADLVDLPALHIIDPALPRRARELGQLIQISNTENLRTFENHIRRHQSVAPTDWQEPFMQHSLDRYVLSRTLRDSPRSRLFYFGHVSAEPDEPGSASIHLDETSSGTWGMADALRAPLPDGTFSAERDDDHRPLSALDLLLGTLTATVPSDWEKYGFDGPRTGHDIWRIPPRVAIIACEGGADYRSSETFGLVIAMLNAGAELVTTTRWILPTDYAFTTHPSHRGSARPTTELALRVDYAHSRPDAVAVLADWQREQLGLWTETGHIDHTPLVWASLTHTLAPARPDTD